jgi:hypothetical protein
MRGPHSEWSLCVTVDVPATEQTEIRTGVVAVDVGWRLMPCSRVDCDHASDCRELRVAAWRDDKDRSGELRLTATDIRALRQSEQLRSKRDTQFDVIKAIVLGWIKTAQDAPEWMTEAAKTMHTWRRQGRMVALLSRWTEDRPERGEQEEIAYQAAVAWKCGRRRWPPRTERLSSSSSTCGTSPRGPRSEPSTSRRTTTRPGPIGSWWR